MYTFQEFCDQLNEKSKNFSFPSSSEISKRISSHYGLEVPANVFIKSERVQWFEKNDITKDDYNAMREILSNYGGTMEQYKIGIKTILEILSNENNPLFQTMNYQINFETKIAYTYIKVLPKLVGTYSKNEHESKLRYGEYWIDDEFDEKEELKELIEQNTALAGLIYRKGTVDHDLESWCKSEEGTPSFRNPNNYIKLEEKLKTHFVLGGLSYMMGSPDDNEITMIRKSLCQNWL